MKLVSLSALNQAVTISRQQIAVIVICISLILEVVLRIAVHHIPINQQAAVLTYFDFIQTEKVTDTMKARSIVAYFTTEDGEKISFDVPMIANSREEAPEKRTFHEKFTLKSREYSNIAEKYFKLGNNLNQRDAIAVRKLISGFIKLIYPDGEVSKDEVAEIMDISLELRRRVKEQLKKIGGMEFYDVNFSYIDNDSFDEHFVTVPEQGGGKMIPEGMGKPGCLYTVSKSKTGMIGCYRLETQMMPGNGKLTCTGIGSGKEPKEATNTAFNYLKANGNAISGSISTTTKDYIINYQDMQGLGMTGNLALPTLIAISSAALSKPPISSLVVLGEISIGGTLIKVEDLASTLQVCLDSGAKKVLLPITSAADLGTVPSDLVGAFSLIFYSSPEEAVYKALGVE